MQLHAGRLRDYRNCCTTSYLIQQLPVLGASVRVANAVVTILLRTGNTTPTNSNYIQQLVTQNVVGVRLGVGSGYSSARDQPQKISHTNSKSTLFPKRAPSSPKG